MELLPQEARRLILDLQSAERSGRATYAQRTIRKIASIWHASFDRAVRAGILDRNPWHGMPGDIIPQATAVIERDRVPFTPLQAHQLVTSLRLPIEERALYAVLLSGVSVSEASALRFQDIDSLEPLPRFLVSRRYNPGDGGIVSSPAREYPILPYVQEIVKEVEVNGWLSLVGRPPSPNDLIFPRVQEGRALPQYQQQMLKRFKQNQEMLKITPIRNLAACRVTFLALVRDAGGNAKLIRDHVTNPGRVWRASELHTRPTWQKICEEALRFPAPTTAPESVRPSNLNSSLKAPASYREVRHVASGGFGSVYEVFSINTGNKNRLAKKVLREDGSSFAARFRREVELMRSLIHPSIVPVLDANLDSEPLWYVMPFYEQSLEDLLPVVITSRSLGDDILDAVFDAVAFAHGRGVIHRDLKPSNIFVPRSAPAVVGDFGMARDLDDAGTRLTVTGARLGTLAYAAPELWDGSKFGDYRADIYSLGRLIYQLHTGLIDPGMEEVGQLHETLQAVVRKATRRRPEDRFSDVRSLAEAYRSSLTAAGSVKARE